MAHRVDEWHDVLLTQLPRGRAWPRDPDADLPRYVRGFAERLRAAELSNEELLREMRPETTVLLLPEWEDYLGLPECNINNPTFESRRAAVVEKYHRKVGLQTWQLQALALTLGFTVTVNEIWPHHILRDVTYPLYAARYRHVLEVVVHNMPSGRMTVLDNVLTPLITSQAAALECLLTRYKLAGKSYDIIYS